MAEGQVIREVEPHKALADAVTEIFERRAKHGDRTLILETYQKKFEQLVKTLPKEQQDSFAIKLQKLTILIGGVFAEYGARINDFIRNVTVWPMIRANKDFPNDVYYQFGLARAQAWGDLAMRTTKTATAARMAYRNYFLPSAFTGSVSGGLLGAMTLGIAEGAQKGLIVAGLQGAAVGAAIGGATGAGIALGLRLKDRIMGGPPVLYFGVGGSASPTTDFASSYIGSALGKRF